MPEGTIWRWCDHCSRMGSHDTDHHCTPKRKSNLKVQFVHKPPAPKSSIPKEPTPVESDTSPPPPSPPKANTTVVFAVNEDIDDVEVEDFLAVCD